MGQLPVWCPAVLSKQSLSLYLGWMQNAILQGEGIRDGVQAAGPRPDGVEGGCSPHSWAGCRHRGPPEGQGCAESRAALGTICLPLSALSASPGDPYFSLSLPERIPNMRLSLRLTFMCLSLFAGR